MSIAEAKDLVADSPTDEVGRRMRRVRREHTTPELAIRSAIHRRGLRYRLHRSVPGVPRVKPDIVFPKARVVVYVDGCFWHRCPAHGTLPKRNREWWEAKLEANVARDRRHAAALRDAGWEVVRIWEHEDPGEAALRIESLVRPRSHR